jgi:hypothetical protein
MNAIDRFDRWLGIKVMHPPIIWICQRTGMTQYAVAKYAWMAAAWTLVMQIAFVGVTDWLFSIAAIVVSLLDTMAAALWPDKPLPSRPLFRRAILAYWVFDVGYIAYQSNLAGQLRFGWNDAWCWLALMAEYAKTIDTIPPRRRTEPKAVRAGT